MTTVRALHEVSRTEVSRPEARCTEAHATTSAEARAAALQYVRVVSGTALPTGPDRRAFHEAVLEIAAITQQLMDRAQERAAHRALDGPLDRAGERAAGSTGSHPDYGSGLAAVG